MMWRRNFTRLILMMRMMTNNMETYILVSLIGTALTLILRLAFLLFNDDWPLIQRHSAPQMAALAICDLAFVAWATFLLYFK